MERSDVTEAPTPSPGPPEGLTERVRDLQTWFERWMGDDATYEGPDLRAHGFEVAPGDQIPAFKLYDAMIKHRAARLLAAVRRQAAGESQER